MKATFTILFLLLLTTLSAQQKTTKANQFAVIDFPRSIVSVSENNENIYLLENWMFTGSGVYIINKQSGKYSHYPIPSKVPYTDLKVCDTGEIYYVVTNEGLYKYNPLTRSSSLVWDKPLKGRSYSIGFSPDSRYLILSGHHNVLLRKGDYGVVTQFDNVTTRKNLVDNSGTVWNMSVSDIHIYNPGDSIPQTYTANKYNSKKQKLTFEHGETNDMIFTPDKHVYLLVNNNIYRTPVHSPGQWTLVSTLGDGNSYEKFRRIISDQSGNLYLTMSNISSGFYSLGKSLPGTFTKEDPILSTHIIKPNSYTDKPIAVETYETCGVMDRSNIYFLSNDNHRMIIYSPDAAYKPFMGKYTQIKKI